MFQAMRSKLRTSLQIKLPMVACLLADMAEANDTTDNGESTKVKRKSLNRRERKSLPSKEEIAEKRYILNKDFILFYRYLLIVSFFHLVLLSKLHKDSTVLIHV